MRVLTSSVLVLEAIVVALAIPVALVVGGSPAWVAWLLGVLAVGCLLLPGAFGRRGYLQAGWAAQAAVITSGFLVPMMFVLGATFAALWWTAVRLGHRAEAARPAA